MSSAKKEKSSPVERFALKMFGDGTENFQRFLAALRAPPERELAALLVHRSAESEEATLAPSCLPGDPSWVRKVAADAEMGKSALHDRGDIYLLDLSSAFFASLLQAVPTRPNVLLDLCASPGGKSVAAWKALEPGLLLSNEVVGKRLPALISNLKRCRINPAAAMTLDPGTLLRWYPDSFPVIVLDAPCSGQSLVMKGEGSSGTFHSSVISMNVRRQRHLASTAARLLAPGGRLLYVTCTYARDENEKLIAWLLKATPHLQAAEVSGYEAYRSPFSDFPSYRVWPWQGIGAGGFATLLVDMREGVPGAAFDPARHKFPWKSW